MTAVRLLILASLLLSSLPTAGCAAQPDKPREAARGSINPRQVQSQLMDFATRYIMSMADVYAQVKDRSPTTEAQLAAVRGKLVAAFDALDNAVEPSPLSGLTDMAVSVTLARQLAEQPWATEVFGAESAGAIVAVLVAQEADVWKLAGTYLTAEQIAELQRLCEQWIREHPNQRFATGISLDDLRPIDRSDPGGGGVPLLSGVVSLVMLDPFAGLDPAVKEVEQSRVLAERMFFYMRHMTALVSWQADALYLQMLEAPPAKRVLADTNTVATSTTQVADSASRFADAGSRFADAGSRFADTTEQFRQQLPEQQAKLMDQLDRVVATQREAAISQATTQITQERDEAIRQLDAVVAAQQKEMASNLQSLMDGSIDRLYERARRLILLSAGALLAALVAYRLFTLVVAKPRA